MFFRLRNGDIVSTVIPDANIIANIKEGHVINPGEGINSWKIIEGHGSSYVEVFVTSNLGEIFSVFPSVQLEVSLEDCCHEVTTARHVGYGYGVSRGAFFQCAACKKSFRMEMLAYKYGTISYEYSQLLNACAKKGVYGFDPDKVLGK